MKERASACVNSRRFPLQSTRSQKVGARERETQAELQEREKADDEGSVRTRAASFQRESGWGTREDERREAEGKCVRVSDLVI